MLDTHARKYISPFLERSADFFIRQDRSPNQITMAAFAIGVSSGPLLALGFAWPAVALLWLSGFLDAVDGTMARKLGQTSPWGTLMDITFDRIVEISVFLGLGLRFPQARFALMVLLAAVILSMTVFLTVGALSKNTGKKSFYYQAGLAERTEGFIMSSLMMLFPAGLVPLTFLYAAAVLFTAGQRFQEAHRLFTR